MSEVKKGVSFVKQVLARITGDEDAVVAEKNYRKATAAVKGQISALEAQVVDREDEVDEAKEALETAKYPTTLINNNREGYITSVFSTKNALTEAEEDLEETKEKIEFLKTLLKEFG